MCVFYSFQKFFYCCPYCNNLCPYYTEPIFTLSAPCSSPLRSFFAPYLCPSLPHSCCDFQHPILSLAIQSMCIHLYQGFEDPFLLLEIILVVTGATCIWSC